MNNHEIHELRLSYLNVLSSFKDMNSATAISLTEKFIRGEETPTPDNPKLDEFNEHLKQASEMAKQRDPNYVDPSIPGNYSAGELGEIAKKSGAKMSDTVEIKKPSDIFTQTPIPTVDMVDPNKKVEPVAEVKAPVKENLHEKIPQKYEDRVKYFEQQANQAPQQTVERPEFKEGQNFKESGGEVTMPQQQG